MEALEGCAGVKSPSVNMITNFQKINKYLVVTEETFTLTMHIVCKLYTYIYTEWCKSPFTLHVSQRKVRQVTSALPCIYIWRCFY